MPSKTIRLSPEEIYQIVSQTEWSLGIFVLQYVILSRLFGCWLVHVVCLCVCVIRKYDLMVTCLYHSLEKSVTLRHPQKKAPFKHRCCIVSHRSIYIILNEPGDEVYLLLEMLQIQQHSLHPA